MVPFFEMFWAFGLVFLSCELAGRLSYRLGEIDEMIGQFKWYLELQKQLPIVMINSQREIGFVCFGSAYCNRETFKKVLKKIVYVLRVKHR